MSVFRREGLDMERSDSLKKINKYASDSFKTVKKQYRFVKTQMITLCSFFSKTRGADCLHSLYSVCYIQCDLGKNNNNNNNYNPTALPQKMAVGVNKVDGVTVVTVASDPQSPYPPLCQIIFGLCCNPLCCVVSETLRKLQGGSQYILGVSGGTFVSNHPISASMGGGKSLFTANISDTHVQ